MEENSENQNSEPNLLQTRNVNLKRKREDNQTFNDQKKEKIGAWTGNPLYETFVKLHICNILTLTPSEIGNNTFLLNGVHIITSAEILGTVVAKFVAYNRVAYTLDDGTGLIACNRWINDLSEGQILNQTSTFEHGDLVLVQGKLNTFRNEMKINIVNIRKVSDPNEEILFWLDCIQLYKSVYSKPKLLQ